MELREISIRENYVSFTTISWFTKDVYTTVYNLISMNNILRHTLILERSFF